MELGNTTIWGMDKSANRCQDNVSEDAEHYLPYQVVLRQVSLLPPRAEPMNWDSKWEGRNFVLLLQLPTFDAYSKALWTHGVPAVAQKPQLLTFTQKKAQVAWSKRSLRWVVHMAHGVQYKCMVQCPLLSFHTDDHTPIRVHAIEKSYFSSSKAVVSSWKTANLEIWPHLKIMSRKRKWTSMYKETIFVQM